MKINIDTYKVYEKKSLSLKKYKTTAPSSFNDKKENKKKLEEIVEEIDQYQNILYAENKQSLLVIFQGIDASGKDSSIKSIMTGVNSQGVEVTSFKTPSSIEYEHDYLWRHIIKMPEHGKIGIFNRSHYENVLICRVHPEFILNERLPSINSVKDVNDEFFENRYKEIRHFEERMHTSGVKIIKFFLNISKEEQKKRFIQRIENTNKNWKFSSSDLKEREYWDEYQKAFTSALENTSTSKSPWYIIPCDNKSYGQLIMGTIILETLKEMNPIFPELSKEEKEALDIAYHKLLNEK